MPATKNAKQVAKKKNANAPAKPAAKKSPIKKSSSKPFTTFDAAEAFRHFLPHAEALPADAVPVRGGDAAIARKNVERGVEAIRPRIAEIPDILPKIALNALLELPALALGLVHADGRVGSTASGREIEAAIARVSPLRDASLRYLEVAADLGLVPAKRVRAVRAGKGKLDNARDCVDIAGIFDEFKGALEGKHPFTNDQFNELATTGTWLVERITPRGTPKTPAMRDPAALVRDRFWKLLEDGHNDLRTAGVALFGIKNVDDYVPPLLSRTSTTSPTPRGQETAPEGVQAGQNP